jgi:hypothetical protein
LAWEASVRHPTVAQRLIAAAAVLSVVTFVGCLIGLIPALLGQVIVGSPLRFDVASAIVFIPIWLLLSAVSFVAAKWFVRLEATKVPSFQRPPVRLARAQLAFLHAHLARRALDSYFQSHLENLHTRAVAHANQLFGRKGLPALRLKGDQYIVDQGAVRKKEKREYVVDVNPRELSRYEVLGTGWVWRIEEYSSALQLAKRGSWFELSPQTLARLQALIQLPEKVMPRLIRGEDLPQVREVLGHFESFLYWTAQGDVPVVTDADEALRKKELSESADRLAQALNALPAVPTDARPTTERGGFTRARLRAWISPERPAVRFVGWTIICSGLAVFAALIVRLFLKVDDNTLATLIIPTAFASAGALTLLTGGKERG